MSTYVIVRMIVYDVLSNLFIYDSVSLNEILNVFTE